MKDLLHVVSGGGGRLVRTFAVLTRAQVGRVPVPPVMFRVRLLVARGDPPFREGCCSFSLSG
jgi:hypothetical protein